VRRRSARQSPHLARPAVRHVRVHRGVLLPPAPASHSGTCSRQPTTHQLGLSPLGRLRAWLERDRQLQRHPSGVMQTRQVQFSTGTVLGRCERLTLGMVLLSAPWRDALSTITPHNGGRDDRLVDPECSPVRRHCSHHCWHARMGRCGRSPCPPRIGVVGGRIAPGNCSCRISLSSSQPSKRIHDRCRLGRGAVASFRGGQLAARVDPATTHRSSRDGAATSRVVA